MRKKAITAIVVVGLLMCGCTHGGNAGPINSKSGENDDKPVSTELPETPVTDGENPVQGLPDVSELPPLSGLGASLSDEDQLQLIWDNRDKWMFRGHVDEGWNVYYALSDLDGNGRLEVITTESYSESNFTTYSLYEVGEDGTDLNYVENGIMEGESMPDIAWGEVFYFAKDKDGSVLGILMTDGLRMDGGSAYSVNTDVVTMKDGRVTYEYIASANTSYDEDGMVTTQYFVDKDGNYLEDWDEFDAYGENYLRKTYPEAEIKVMVVASMYATEAEKEEDVYDLLKESLRKHGEYDNIDDYYQQEYYQGAGEDGKGSDWIERNGSLETRNLTAEDLKNTFWGAFEEYIFESGIYYDYETDTEGFFNSTNLYIDRDGTTGKFYYNGYNGQEEWTVTSISFDSEPGYYAYATLKNGDYEMNSVMQFYYFNWTDGGEPIEVIGMEFGEEYIYFWPVG